MPGDKSRHAWVVALVWAMSTFSALGQVQWAVDTTQIQWGEPLQLTAEWLLSMDELQSGVADSNAWPAWTDTTTAGLEVLSSSPIDTLAAPLASGQDILLRKTWTLTSWDSGFVVMPPELFGPHTTSPLLIRVLTPVLAEDAQPMPPADIVAVEWSLWERLQRTWPMWVACLGLLGLVLLARFLWKHKPQRKADPTSVAPVAPEEPPHVVALRVLNDLKNEEGWNHGRAKEVQALASLTLRQYLEGRFGLPAAERTTSDIAALLPASAVPVAWQTRLVQAFEQADAVKFAKGELPARTHLALLEAYIDFVLDTQNTDDDAR